MGNLLMLDEIVVMALLQGQAERPLCQLQLWFVTPRVTEGLFSLFVIGGRCHAYSDVPSLGPRIIVVANEECTS